MTKAGQTIMSDIRDRQSEIDKRQRVRRRQEEARAGKKIINKKSEEEEK